MDIELLKQYKDACALCDDIDNEIEQLRKEQNEPVSDCVTGSDSQYPYVSRKFTVSGVSQESEYWEALERQIKELYARKADAAKIKAEVETFLRCVPFRIQRIINYKIMKGMTWERVADKMGGKYTGDSLRMELKRYLDDYKKKH